MGRSASGMKAKSTKAEATDSRLFRKKLPPGAFAWGSGKPDPLPSDLIDPETWSGIVHLSDRR